jgi:REP element-mobilizing transposase RayT
VITRGNDRGRIVRDHEDREAFLRALAESASNAGVIVHAFCLMDNHYHLLVETPLANLPVFVRRLNHSHAYAFNRRHRRIGHLFHGRYKAILVERDSYLAAVSRYIHLIPARGKSAARRPAKERLRAPSPTAEQPAGYLDPRRACLRDPRSCAGPFGGHRLGAFRLSRRLAEDLATKVDVPTRCRRAGHRVGGTLSEIANVSPDRSTLIPPRAIHAHHHLAGHRSGRGGHGNGA